MNTHHTVVTSVCTQWEDPRVTVEEADNVAYTTCALNVPEGREYTWALQVVDPSKPARFVTVTFSYRTGRQAQYEHFCPRCGWGCAGFLCQPPFNAPLVDGERQWPGLWAPAAIED